MKKFSPLRLRKLGYKTMITSGDDHFYITLDLMVGVTVNSDNGNVKYGYELELYHYPGLYSAPHHLAIDNYVSQHQEELINIVLLYNEWKEE